MKKNIISTILCIFCCISLMPMAVRAEEVSSLGYTHTNDDYIVIPDKYNTGVDASVNLIPFTEDTVVEGTVLSDDGGNAPAFQYRTDITYYNVINYYMNGNLATKSMVEGYDFSERRLITTNVGNYSEPKTIIFKNCKFHEFSSGYGNLYFVFENCTFTGIVEGSNMTLNKCYIETQSTDALHTGNNFFVNDTFVANIFPIPTDTGKHVDGVQIFGDGVVGCSNIHFNNVRFAAPDFYYDGSSLTYVNAAIMLSMRQSDCDDISFENIVIDMGGHTFAIYNDDMEEWIETNIVYRNVRVSDNYAPNKIFYHTFIEDTIVENVVSNSKLYVSSVWKDENNKTHIICTNHSTTDRTLKVVTNIGEYSFDIDRSPTQTELLNDEFYRTYTYEDMPYDVEFIINEDIDYLVCYDTSVLEENQIRYVNYSEGPLTRPENPNNGVAEDGNIRFEANIASYFEVVIPNSFSLKDLENTLEFTVSGDIAGNKKLTIKTDKTCLLKNEQEEELVAETSIEKEDFFYLDLKESKKSNFLISVDRLPAGRYVGYMPVYIKINDANNNQGN